MDQENNGSVDNGSVDNGSGNRGSGNNGKENNGEKKFRPYIGDDQKQKEFTVASVVMGVLLAVVFGAANAYLGLRVGLTVSASIPAAVMSMGVIRLLLKKDSILESNMVQTIGSAGEALAGGAIFTFPVFFLWEAEGVMDMPELAGIALMALFGGILGVLFMIPLREVLIVKEHERLPYPEGTACAEVLLAGEKGGKNAGLVFLGLGFSAVVKLLVDGLKIVPGVLTAKISALKTELSTEVYPALIGVGYICGPKISSYMFAGGLLGWLVIIPAIVLFGGESVLYPGTDSIAAMYASGGASAIWGSYLRYVGAGAVAAGGIISLVKSLPLIISTFANVLRGIKNGGGASSARTERSLDIRLVFAGIVVIILMIWLLPQIPVSWPGALMVTVFGFFFGAVSARMVGLVGSSNSPVSGMTIAVLLMAASLMKATGSAGAAGMAGALAIGAIVCIISAMAADTSQDLKTGFLLGATPVKQQIGEIVGVIISAIVIGGVLMLLHSAWGFGSKELAAPQATLMKMIVEGVMHGVLPWGLVLIGVFIAVVIEILRIPVLPVAIGLYLPLELSVTVMIGGLIRLAADAGRRRGNASGSDRGILFCSGMIAGEGLIGILLAILTVTGVADMLDLSGRFQAGTAGGIIVLSVIVLAVGRAALQKASDA